MLEEKKGSVSAYIQPTKLVGDCGVSVSFKAKANGCCVCKLKACSMCNCFPAGSEEACLCYAMYIVVQDALCGSPAATAKSKVSKVECGTNGGDFSIAWRVKGTVSAVRKSLGIALKCLNPGKLYSIYVQCVKAAGGKPNREAFNYVAAELAASLKDGVQVGVIGNIKADSAKLKAMLDVVSGKLSVGAIDGKKVKPSDHTACDHSAYAELKTDGWQAFVAKDYIDAKVRGLNVLLCDRYLLVHTKASQWDTLAKKVKKYVKDYVAAKYMRVNKDDLPAVLGYMMLSDAAVGSGDIKSMLKSGLTAASVEKAITDVL